MTETPIKAVKYVLEDDDGDSSGRSHEDATTPCQHSQPLQRVKSSFLRGSGGGDVLRDSEVQNAIQLMDGIISCGECECLEEEQLEWSRPKRDIEYATVQTPEQDWKAHTLRVLRDAEDGAMTLGTLVTLAPYPIPGELFLDMVRIHLVERMLVRWVVENESVQVL